MTVNLATEKADVTYDPARVRLSGIKKAITDAGYTPREVDATDAVDHDAERKEREIRVMWTRFIVAASASVPLLYLALVHMIPGARIPLPAFLDPMRFPLSYAMAQIILVIPAIIAGSKFYRVGAESALAQGAQHGLPDRHRDRGRGPVQHLQHSPHRPGGRNGGEEPLLRDCRGHPRP